MKFFEKKKKDQNVKKNIHLLLVGHDPDLPLSTLFRSEFNTYNGEGIYSCDITLNGISHKVEADSADRSSHYLWNAGTENIALLYCFPDQDNPSMWDKNAVQYMGNRLHSQSESKIKLPTYILCYDPEHTVTQPTPECFQGQNMIFVGDKKPSKEVCKNILLSCLEHNVSNTKWPLYKRYKNSLIVEKNLPNFNFTKDNLPEYLECNGIKGETATAIKKAVTTILIANKNLNYIKMPKPILLSIINTFVLEAVRGEQYSSNPLDDNDRIETGMIISKKRYFPTKTLPSSPTKNNQSIAEIKEKSTSFRHVISSDKHDNLINQNTSKKIVEIGTLAEKYLHLSDKKIFSKEKGTMKDIKKAIAQFKETKPESSQYYELLHSIDQKMDAAKTASNPKNKELIEQRIKALKFAVIEMFSSQGKETLPKKTEKKKTFSDVINILSNNNNIDIPSKQNWKAVVMGASSSEHPLETLGKINNVPVKLGLVTEPIKQDKSRFQLHTTVDNKSSMVSGSSYAGKTHYQLQHTEDTTLVQQCSLKNGAKVTFLGVGDGIALGGHSDPEESKAVSRASRFILKHVMREMAALLRQNVSFTKVQSEMPVILERVINEAKQKRLVLGKDLFTTAGSTFSVAAIVEEKNKAPVLWHMSFGDCMLAIYNTKDNTVKNVQGAVHYGTNLPYVGGEIQKNEKVFYAGKMEMKEGDIPFFMTDGAWECFPHYDDVVIPKDKIEEKEEGVTLSPKDSLLTCDPNKEVIIRIHTQEAFRKFVSSEWNAPKYQRMTLLDTEANDKQGITNVLKEGKVNDSNSLTNSLLSHVIKSTEEKRQERCSFGYRLHQLAASLTDPRDFERREQFQRAMGLEESEASTGIISNERVEEIHEKFKKIFHKKDNIEEGNDLILEQLESVGEKEQWEKNQFSLINSYKRQKENQMLGDDFTIASVTTDQKKQGVGF